MNCKFPIRFIRSKIFVMDALRHYNAKYACWSVASS
uniref:Uncharacterized protein n=1 Tax=Arundo donax TaxID=35708 RepID=A0A0A8ZXT5_ARUDO